MSDLTDRLRDTTYETDVCHEAAAVLDAIDALHQPDYEYPDECTECDFAWPCDTHLLIHPDVPA